MEVVAICHVHSTWSYDGSWPLEQLAAEFIGRGARVLMMTEHDRGFSERRLTEYREACLRASSERLCVIPGIEYSDAENRVHVLTWGRVPFLGEGLATDVVLEGVRRNAGVAVLAHPKRRDAWLRVQDGWRERLNGIEMWNRKYDGWAPAAEAPELIKQTGCLPFVGLDFHTRRQMFPLTMLFDVQGPIDEDNVIRSIRERHCTPAAFGAPLTAARIERKLAVLRIAERWRSSIASAKRKLQGSTKASRLPSRQL